MINTLNEPFDLLIQKRVNIKNHSGNMSDVVCIIAGYSHCY
jgi:hypothetical protein